MKKSHLPVLMAALSLPACGSDDGKGADCDGAACTSDYDKIADCGGAACGSGSAQWIEGETQFSMYGMECIVEGMRDRKPGVYEMSLDHTFSNGSDTRNLRLFVTPSGEVEIASHLRSEIEDNVEDTDEPGRRCSLAPVSFFEDCLTAVQAGDGDNATAEAWACVNPGPTEEPPWFEGCAEKSPTCE